MTVFQTPSGSWRAEIRRNRRGQKAFRDTATFTTKAEAETYDKAVKAALDKADDADLIIPQKITLTDLLTGWWEDRQESIAKSNRRAMHRRMLKWQKSYLGEAIITQITLRQIRGWVKSRRKRDGVSESTIRNDLSVLQAAWAWAAEDKEWLLPDVLAPVVKSLGKSKERDRRPTQDEHSALLSAFQTIANAQENWTGPKGTPISIEIAPDISIRMGYSPGLALMPQAFLAAIECAARKSRLFSFTWREVDLKGRYINVQVLGPDNKQVPAHIPMSPTLVDLFTEMHGPQRIGKARDEPIFGTLTAEVAYRCFLDVEKALDIKDLHWHDLRHESVSRLSEIGFSAGLIQQITGHKTLRSVERYMHVRPQAVLAMWDRIAAQDNARQSA